MSGWYYSKNGEQKGPISREELSAMKSSGEVITTDLVWKEGMSDWLPLGQVDEFGGGGPPLTSTASVENTPLVQPQSYSVQSGQQVQNIPSYLIPSIIATLLGGFLCALVPLPLGIVAIVFASKVEGLQLRGDYAGAMSASKAAKTWMIVSFACSGLMIASVILMFIVGALGSV
jgi:hypothetical protein